MSKRFDIDAMESQRLTLQAILDGQKTQAQRNKLGQFATPTALARDILAYAKDMLPTDLPVRFLDPAIGTGAFYSALLKVFPKSSIEAAQGFEIDRHYGLPASDLWDGTGLELSLADFTTQDVRQRFNLLICNPPYVRHHHMANEEKARLQHRNQLACGTKFGGLAGLYCYFLGLSHAWLAPGAISGWLIPSEFMDVNYGQAVKRYLLERVTLLHIHRFDPTDVQFADALVSSAIVWFRNEQPPANHAVEFSFGGSMRAPKLSKMLPAAELAKEKKWTRFPAADVREKSTLPVIADFFKIKRGLATGDNGYFILNAETIAARELPLECFRPILPSPRYVSGEEITADDAGLPRLDKRLFLLDPRLPEREIEERYPSLWAYLEEGKQKGLHERYLCRHRSLWYSQENRPPAPIVCTYLGRGDSKSGRPFRFILNHSQATVANVYLAMYPTPILAHALAEKPGLIRVIWEALNQISPDQLLGEGRVYGGGLHKLEPKELANVPVPEIAALVPNLPVRQSDMIFEAAE
ncbi:Eco57I restriction-modification methylase domain-containing protein [Rhizobium sp. AG855]|uniref:Eco57I restriction-modification methylase domain-containing protein n=1 Tax=Rhizobium sp. AG855 TaxID=2183898 RepID=UPI000FF71785|nr:Eco57I restriction-modification methylase domain-containing protein [Rhizobium sp. AG855]RKE75890.1 Eco57I restriction-modification methylase [Rhizobium sp. AG855]